MRRPGTSGRYGWQFQGSSSRAQSAQQPPNLDTINLQIEFAVAKNDNEFKQTRCTGHGMSLEKSFAR
jgi:hypothetical protein